MNESWLPIPGFEGYYEVSDQGRVRGLDRVGVITNKHGCTYTRRIRGRVLKLKTNNMGYYYLCLYRDTEKQEWLVHRLVLTVFVGPCPPGLWGCHADDAPKHNWIGNLRWDTPSANRFDSVNNGSHYQANQTHCKRRHKFTPENTRIRKCDGGRECRECDRLRGSHDKRIKRSEIAA